MNMRIKGFMRACCWAGLVARCLLWTGEAMAQRGERRIQRIDREVQKQVFIPKGTWMAGGSVSYSEHD